MIKANELRVGNIVEKNGGQFVADFITIQMAHNYNPIPLTNEILNDCGFSYLKIDNIASLDDYKPDGCTHNWTLKLKRQGIYNGNGALELVKWGDEPSDKLWYVDQWLRVEMKTLHQLQNLYFALTGEELNVKL